MDGDDPSRNEPDVDGPEADQATASALVILRGAVTGNGPAADDGDRPDPLRARHVQDHLRSLGFDVGALIGTSFSISAPAGLFRRSFGQEPPTGPPTLGVDRSDDADDADDTGAGADRGAHGRGEHELSIDQLPGDDAAAIEAIVFAPPPDFGPTAP